MRLALSRLREQELEFETDHRRVLGLDFPHLAHPVRDMGLNQRLKSVSFLHGLEDGLG